MVNKLAWHILIDVVGFITTLAKAWNSIRLRKRCASPGWFKWVWVGCVLGDLVAKITLVVLMCKRNHPNFGAWASASTLLFIMFEEALVLLQVCHGVVLGTNGFTMTPHIRSLATLLFAELCGFVFVLSGQFSQHGMLSTGLVMAGCAVFSGLYAAALVVIQKGRARIGLPKIKIDYPRIILPRGVIIGGNLFVLLYDEWITRMLVFATTMEIFRIIDVIWHHYPSLVNPIRDYIPSDGNRHKRFARSQDGRTASSEEQLVTDDYSTHEAPIPAPQAALIRSRYDITQYTFRESQ